MARAASGCSQKRLFQYGRNDLHRLMQRIAAESIAASLPDSSFSMPWPAVWPDRVVEVKAVDDLAAVFDELDRPASTTGSTLSSMTATFSGSAT